MVAAANDDMDAGDDGGGSFLPLGDNGMEMDQSPQEHIERNQVPHHSHTQKVQCSNF